MRRNVVNPHLPSNIGKLGFILLHILVAGSLLLFLGLVFFFFANQQHVNIHIQANAERAHFLAESGINATMAALREDDFSILKKILSQTSLPSEILLTSHFPENWNQQLSQLAKEADKTASLQVTARLQGLKQTETDPLLWQDPTAKIGWLSIESRGEYQGFQRTLTIRKKIKCGNALPPVTSKFTLHLQDAFQGKDGSQNMIRNDLHGTVLQGPQPVVCFNHNTPDNPSEPQSHSKSPSNASSSSPYEKRGWIWLGGKRIRLNLAAGFTGLGELFHFPEAAAGNSSVALSFKLSPDLLQRYFFAPISLYWDRIDINPMREVRYQLGHGFVLQGFYDKSGSPGLEAMYDGGVLSHAERERYGVKSSLYHLFGDARTGYQSKTKVLGNVFAAFPLFSNLEITPQETDVQSSFQNQNPAPLFLLPSMSEREFDPSKQITEFRNRHFGGPVLAVQDLTDTYSEYRKIMSRVVEIPFGSTSGFLEATSQGKISDEASGQDSTGNLTLNRDHLTIYQGPVHAPHLITVVENRVQKEVESVSDFWKAFYDSTKHLLNVNHIVRIGNPQRHELIFPPREYPVPVVVAKGGMIILEEGNLLLRGVKVSSPDDTLTIILKKGTHVRFENSLPNLVNIVALQGELTSAEHFSLCGTLAVSKLSPVVTFPGGAIHYRESQDPTQPSYLKFVKVSINETDTIWHE